MVNYQEKTPYNEIVGITKDHTVVILDYTFKYSDGFKGATYIEIGCLTQGEIDRENDLENIKEQCRDLWIQAVDADETELGLDDYTKQMLEEKPDDCYFFGDDPSFRWETDKAYEKLTDEQRAAVEKVLGEKGKDFIDWHCGSCGRIGDSYKNWDWEVLLRPDLLEEIAKYES